MTDLKIDKTYTPVDANSESIEMGNLMKGVKIRSQFENNMGTLSDKIKRQRFIDAFKTANLNDLTKYGPEVILSEINDFINKLK